MINLVQEIDALLSAVTLEQTLRVPTELELSAGLESGPMHQAHTAQVAHVVALCRLVVEKHDAG